MSGSRQEAIMNLPSLNELDRHRIHQQEVRSAYGDYVLSTYFIGSDLLTSLNISNWEKNRPPDLKRVRDVARDITTSGRVQGIIALVSLSGSLVCYDGNHRRLALATSDTTYKVLVTIIWAATEEQLAASSARRMTS